MDQKPFLPLDRSRLIGRNDLPPDLAGFYERNEGIGLASNPDRNLRICRLEEIKDCRWKDVRVLGSETVPGWEDFRGFYLGVSSFLDGIFRVVKAPCCPTGSILALGPDVAGPGGVGEYPLEPSLVLASSLENWLARLEGNGWFEYGLSPGDIWDLPKRRRADVRTYYQALNPGLQW